MLLYFDVIEKMFQNLYLIYAKLMFNVCLFYIMSFCVNVIKKTFQNLYLIYAKLMLDVNLFSNK